MVDWQLSTVFRLFLSTFFLTLGLDMRRLWLWIGLRIGGCLLLALFLLHLQGSVTVLGQGIGKLYLPVILVSGAKESDEAKPYRVWSIYNKFQRTALARTGASIDNIGPDWVEISAISA